MYLDCCYTEYQVKETASLHLKLPSKVIFLERLLFVYFIPISRYLDQILLRQVVKVASLVKTQTVQITDDAIFEQINRNIFTD